ncbi:MULTISPECIES: transporter [unclassified Burkholderia]|uniref:transporter n=1 Tax=unclassified Burkholderia TaxID=2613784 RepID=UPI000F5860C8|nr:MULTISPECIES: transporter [unclassified Burkholderia]RQR26085.1 transporter [Burkholderia sp. Bp9142]RQR50538.1 transporter [Burkholderia sp. Bp9140]
MKGSDHTRRDGTGGRPTRLGRMPPIVPIASMPRLSCAWIATPRHASADANVRTKLASLASAVGAWIRDATLASRIRAARVAGRGLTSSDIDVQVHGRVAALFWLGALSIEHVEGAWTDFLTSAHRPA